MTAVTLEQAERIIDAIIARGAALNCRPLAVIVVEPGCKVKAFKKEDGASMIRFEMAFGKAYAALSLGRSSKLVRERAQERPIFMRYLIAASGEQIFPEGGGMLIRDSDGVVVGAVGVTGDTEDRDEELAVHGIHAAGSRSTRIVPAWGGGSGCRRKADDFSRTRRSAQKCVYARECAIGAQMRDPRAAPRLRHADQRGVSRSKGIMQIGLFDHCRAWRSAAGEAV